MNEENEFNNVSAGVTKESGNVSGKDGDNKKDSEKNRKPFADTMEWISSIIYAVAAMLALNLFFMRSITVSGNSMNDTLVNGDMVIGMDFCYTPKYGDIVVLQADRLENKQTHFYGEAIIKRVIATEGDTVRINFEKGEVYRNGELLNEDYIKELTHLRVNDFWMKSNEDYVVPENCIFVMGDNRNVSNDSRNLKDVGFVDKNYIMGKAFVRVAPIQDFKWL